LAERLDLNRDGAARHDRAALSILDALKTTLGGQPQDRAGVRLHGVAALRPLLDAAGPIGGIAARHLGPATIPVRAVLFDKTPTTNWALGWHQDRTIVVRQRIEVEGFGPWTVKAGLQHVEPPFGVLEQMITLRIHLDAVPADNAPLMIALGSHRRGRIAEDRIAAVLDASEVRECLAEPGDVWCYATPILHASRASSGAQRRVLQVDYHSESLPDGLSWLGV
jgi:hypothetical protein